MQKNEFVAIIAEKTGLTKKDAEAAVNAYNEAVMEALAKGDKVPMVGFGTFEAKPRPARKGRNPQTKEEITIPASVAVTFKVGKSFKDAVNNK